MWANHTSSISTLDPPLQKCYKDQMTLHKISIRGAREHNLKNISVDIPRDKFVVITGLSGSGKSSLAFDTIYAEGQRRYVESLSAYARQFLELMQKPDVDSIEGLSPAISIEQKTTSRNPRSTVGTITEIYDYLRLLYARIGVPHSPATGLPIKSQTVSEMVDRVMAMPEGTKLLLLSPIVRGRKGEYKKELQELRKKGFTRFKIDGTMYEAEELPDLNKTFKHDISVVVDRIVVRPGLEARLADTMETAVKLSDGLVLAEDATTGEETLFSEKFACPVSGFTISEIEPRLFSFNNPFGACPVCDGLGAKLVFDRELIIPDPKKSIADGAIEPWSGPFADYYHQALTAVAIHFDIPVKAPFAMLPKDKQDIFLYGSGEDIVPITYVDRTRTFQVKKPFEGVIHNLERRWKETESDKVRDDLSKYQSSLPCDGCHGYRLKPEGLSVKIHGKHIAEISDLAIDVAGNWFKALPEHLTPKEKNIAERILKEIQERLHFLASVGLTYLTLSRMSGTLSGGESQRIRLASQIGSGLVGVLYVLDEPSIGLHQRDNDKLLTMLKRLRDLGNTVIVVEHDEDAIRQADHVIDMGPGAGIHGGYIIAQGTPQDIVENPKSITGAYLSHKEFITVPKHRREGNGHFLKLRGATTNNLQNVDVDFPLGKFICVTGVSGGGKSSLTIETLYQALNKQLNNARISSGQYKSLEGVEFLDKIIDIDQAPIGRTPRSNPATYTGLFTPIREWFAKLPEAKARGYEAGRFSFNVKGGRCEACEGDGVIKIEMHFLPDVYVTCDHCKGKRYNRETLDIKFKDKSIADILDMTVEEGVIFFENVSGIRDKLETLHKVGLGYMQIGQRATTLSGGEAQRIKLSKELSRRATGKTVYILDEPTTGLHFHDVKQLLHVLHTIADQGNTVIVIEHNLEVIKTADWVIDLGPEGGSGGGHIVAQGTPEQVAQVKESYTGQYLKAYVG